MSITREINLTGIQTNLAVNPKRLEFKGLMNIVKLIFAQGGGKTSNPELMFQYKAMITRPHGCPSDTSQFTCDDDHCVSHSQVLDHHEDCPDGSDENINNFPCLTDKRIDIPGII